jgi:uncharacterized iron-regulated protein
VNARLALAALVVVAVSLAPGCARHGATSGVQQPIASGRSWISTQHRDHPLVGRIWDARAGAFIDEAALDAALAAADLVLLGEVHDNPDAHLIQARLLGAITATGRRPALAFEMLDEDLQPAVDASLASHPRDPDALGRAVDWEHGGWYDFSMYRPIFAVGLGVGLPVVAANLPRPVAKDVTKRGREALTPALDAQLARYEPLPPDVARSLRDEMRASHCDAPLPEPFLDKLALAQRARDAQMANRMLAHATAGGAVLVTGDGHARKDRGVPAVLAREAPGRTAAAVGILEVVPGKDAPGGYGAEFGTDGPPFHYVVFIPATEREDPCAEFRAHDWGKKMTQ